MFNIFVGLKFVSLSNLFLSSYFCFSFRIVLFFPFLLFSPYLFPLHPSPYTLLVTTSFFFPLNFSFSPSSSSSFSVLYSFTSFTFCTFTLAVLYLPLSSPFFFHLFLPLLSRPFSFSFHLVDSRKFKRCITLDLLLSSLCN